MRQSKYSPSVSMLKKRSLMPPEPRPYRQLRSVASLARSGLQALTLRTTQGQAQGPFTSCIVAAKVGNHDAWGVCDVGVWLFPNFDHTLHFSGDARVGPREGCFACSSRDERASRGRKEIERKQQSALTLLNAYAPKCVQKTGLADVGHACHHHV